jgi:arginyl-tRNA synthetase
MIGGRPPIIRAGAKRKQRAGRVLARRQALSFNIHMNLQHLIQDKLRAALTGMVADVEPYVAMVKPTQDAKHGDYQANCAMSLAKAVGKKPRDCAQQIADLLELGDLLEKPEIAGPGFINLRLQSAWLARQLQAVARDDRLGVAKVAQPRTFVIDFSSPNVAKPLHVGHLRSTIIGDALTRLLRFLGHHVIADNHLGDWGTQFGMLIYGYKHFRDEAALAADPVRELARLYKLVHAQMKSDDVEDGNDPVSQACRDETARLHAGDPENRRLWEMFMPWCLEELKPLYQRLDVRFDEQHGESFYNPMLPGVVEDLEKRGIAERSQGALVIFVGNREKEPPAIVQKKDGAFTYTTSDLATIKYRAERWNADAILYLVGFPQSLHFKNLFAAVRRWGYDKVELQHVPFGSVLGEDGKLLRTRSGAPIELETLLSEAIERAAAVYAQSRKEAIERGEDVVELSPADQQQVAEVVGIGAVKYADLSQNRTSDYVFSWPKMLAMNGNTATYMQYAYARNRSIFRKASADPERYRSNPPSLVLESPYERALALQLLRLEEKLRAAAAEYQPSGVTAYLWDLAKTYSGFFQNCPVLRAETTELRESRLLLCDLTARVLQLCLNLLGIRTVERM